MKHKSLIISGLFLISIPAMAQQERKDIRDGNRLFRSDKFNESEVSYRKAIDLQSNTVPGSFNLGDALYRQEKFEDAGILFNQVADKNVDKNTKSQAFHNLGNSLLKAGELDDAIEAYKNALRNIPDDMETKYNLAYAQNLKKKQEEQKQENQDQKDKQENQQKQEQQQQDQEKKDQKQQQPQEGKISKEDAQRLLEALANDEKKVQENVKKEKAKSQRVRVLKDW